MNFYQIYNLNTQYIENYLCQFYHTGILVCFVFCIITCIVSDYLEQYFLKMADWNVCEQYP